MSFYFNKITLYFKKIIDRTGCIMYTLSKQTRKGEKMSQTSQKNKQKAFSDLVIGKPQLVLSEEGHKITARIIGKAKDIKGKDMYYSVLFGTADMVGTELPSLPQFVQSLSVKNLSFVKGSTHAFTSDGRLLKTTPMNHSEITTLFSDFKIDIVDSYQNIALRMQEGINNLQTLWQSQLKDLPIKAPGVKPSVNKAQTDVLIDVLAPTPQTKAVRDIIPFAKGAGFITEYKMISKTGAVSSELMGELNNQSFCFNGMPITKEDLLFMQYENADRKNPKKLNINEANVFLQDLSSALLGQIGSASILERIAKIQGMIQGDTIKYVDVILAPKIPGSAGAPVKKMTLQEIRAENDKKNADRKAQKEADRIARKEAAEAQKAANIAKMEAERKVAILAKQQKEQEAIEAAQKKIEADRIAAKEKALNDLYAPVENKTDIAPIFENGRGGGFYYGKQNGNVICISLNENKPTFQIFTRTEARAMEREEFMAFWDVFEQTFLENQNSNTNENQKESVTSMHEKNLNQMAFLFKKFWDEGFLTAPKDVPHTYKKICEKLTASQTVPEINLIQSHKKPTILMQKQNTIG